MVSPAADRPLSPPGSFPLRTDPFGLCSVRAVPPAIALSWPLSASRQLLLYPRRVCDDREVGAVENGPGALIWPEMTRIILCYGLTHGRRTVRGHYMKRLAAGGTDAAIGGRTHLRTIPIPRGRGGPNGRGSDPPASPMVRAK
jgi:hypothetical protein